jgi:peptidyl-prolyl cis-trans isomerase C
MKNQTALSAALFAVVPAFCSSVLVAKAQAAPTTAAPTTAAPTTAAPATAKPAAITIPSGANPIAATVNKDKIERADLERLVESARQLNPALKGDTPASKAALQAARARILDNLIDNRLFYQETVRRKIVPAPAAVNQQIADFKKQFPDNAAFLNFLKTGGKTEADFRRVVIEQLAINELSDRLKADITVSDAEVKTYYTTHASEFQVPETVRAHHILLRTTKTASAADKAKVRARTVDLMKKTQAKGADFEALARQFSEDPSAVQDGGDLGLFSREEITKPFTDAAFAASKGQIVGPVETELGYHIIRVDEKTPAHTAPLDKTLTGIVRAALLKQKISQKLETTIAGLKKTATIKTNL